MTKLVRLLTITEQMQYVGNGHSDRLYYLSDCFVNKNYIIKIKEDLRMVELFLKGKLPSGFDPNQKFTLLTLARGNMGEDISVVGSMEYIIRKFEE